YKQEGRTERLRPPKKGQLYIAARKRTSWRLCDLRLAQLQGCAQPTRLFAKWLIFGGNGRLVDALARRRGIARTGHQRGARRRWRLQPVAGFDRHRQRKAVRQQAHGRQRLALLSRPAQE